MKRGKYEFRYESQEDIDAWRSLFAHLIDLCLEIASVTGPIVSSSSPEGMMPMELTDSMFAECFVSMLTCHLICFAVSDKVEDENLNGQVTSQMLLVCCWRTIKEISLLFSRLGQLGIKFIQNKDQYKFISLNQVLTRIELFSTTDVFYS